MTDCVNKAMDYVFRQGYLIDVPVNRIPKFTQTTNLYKACTEAVGLYSVWFIFMNLVTDVPRNVARLTAVLQEADEDSLDQYIVGGQTSDGTPHVQVWQGGKLVLDPNNANHNKPVLPRIANDAIDNTEYKYYTVALFFNDERAAMMKQLALNEAQAQGQLN